MSKHALRSPFPATSPHLPASPRNSPHLPATPPQLPVFFPPAARPNGLRRAFFVIFEKHEKNNVHNEQKATNLMNVCQFRPNLTEMA